MAKAAVTFSKVSPTGDWTLKPPRSPRLWDSLATEFSGWALPPYPVAPWPICPLSCLSGSSRHQHDPFPLQLLLSCQELLFRFWHHCEGKKSSLLSCPTTILDRPLLCQLVPWELLSKMRSRAGPCPPPPRIAPPTALGVKVAAGQNEFRRASRGCAVGHVLGRPGGVFSSWALLRRKCCICVRAGAPYILPASVSCLVYVHMYSVCI